MAWATAAGLAVGAGVHWLLPDVLQLAVGVPAILRIPPELERKQIGRVRAVRERRDTEAADAALSDLREAAAADRNLMEPLLDCARADCTEGEIVQSLQRVFGTYTETPVF